MVYYLILLIDMSFNIELIFMKTKSYALVLLIVILFTSCTEKFDINFENATSKMVVEGVITNDTTRIWVNISKTDPNLGYNPILVSGASVRVWNTAGDTLVLQEVSRGHYEATNTIGKSGDVFNLLVKYKEEEYSASSYMPPLPSLDSLTVKYTGLDRVRIFFEEPANEENYYLFRSIDPAGPWNIIVVSDKFISPNIATDGYVLFAGRRIDMKNGLSPFGVGPWERLIISVSSLNRLDYNYFCSLGMQFSTNGGAYSPAPANPKGNISNGALGLFRASSVSYVTHYPDSI